MLATHMGPARRSCHDIYSTRSVGSARRSTRRSTHCLGEGPETEHRQRRQTHPPASLSLSSSGKATHARNGLPCHLPPATCQLPLNSSPWPLSFLTVETDGSAGTDPEATCIVFTQYFVSKTQAHEARAACRPAGLTSPLTVRDADCSRADCQPPSDGVFHMATPVPCRQSLAVGKNSTMAVHGRPTAVTEPGCAWLEPSSKSKAVPLNIPLA
jgi:hypothetical protein